MNPRVPRFLLLVTRIECVVVCTAAVVGFFAPGIGSTIWAWTPAPFNARYLGAIYFATLSPLLVFGVSGRWSPGRVVVPMIFTFTTSVALVMIAYRDQFEWGRPATYIFWFLYLFIPVNSAVYLYLLRTLPSADAEVTLPGNRARSSLLALALAIYGLALLLIPSTAASFWAWPVDAFHGRIYAATFLAPAVGVWLLRRSGSRSEWKTVGAFLVTLGVFSIVAVVWTSSGVPLPRKVHYETAGTWAYFALNTLAAIAGAWMMTKKCKTSSH